MFSESELRTATTQIVSSAAVVLAGSLVSEINPDGRTRSLADALGGVGGNILAIELQHALQAQIVAFEILGHQQLCRLATRALGLVVKRAAETSQKPAIQEAAVELRKFAPAIIDHWQDILLNQNRTPGPAEISFPPLPGFLHRFDTGLMELRTLDIPRWQVALRETRNVRHANVQDAVLDLLAPKLYRLHPQACAECLSLTPRSSDGLRLRMFQSLIAQLPTFVDRGPRDRREEVRDAARKFLGWAGTAHELFLQHLDPETRTRYSELLTRIQQLLEECEVRLNQRADAVESASRPSAEIAEVSDDAESTPSAVPEPEPLPVPMAATPDSDLSGLPSEIAESRPMLPVSDTSGGDPACQPELAALGSACLETSESASSALLDPQGELVTPAVDAEARGPAPDVSNEVEPATDCRKAAMPDLVAAPEDGEVTSSATAEPKPSDGDGGENGLTETETALVEPDPKPLTIQFTIDVLAGSQAPIVRRSWILK
jgi:hypothetical protein